MQHPARVNPKNEPASLSARRPSSASVSSVVEGPWRNRGAVSRNFPSPRFKQSSSLDGCFSTPPPFSSLTTLRGNAFQNIDAADSSSGYNPYSRTPEVDEARPRRVPNFLEGLSDSAKAIEAPTTKRKTPAARVGLNREPKANVAAKNSLTHDLLSYFQQESARDVQVVCQGHVMWSSRILLAARSPVFDCMLGPKSTFLESKTQLIEIEDSEPHLVEAFLDAVHSDNCQLFRGQDLNSAEALDDLLDLYLLADKYQFASLIKRCGTLIARRINRTNVLKIFNNIETTMSSDDLKLKCMEVFQSINGADLLRMVRGYDMWEPMRSMNVELVIIGNNPEKSRNKTGSFQLMCCAHDSVDTLKSRIADMLHAYPDNQDAATSAVPTSGVSPSVQREGEGKYRVHKSGLKLVHSATLLENSRTLSECGISNNSTIFVLDGCSIAPSNAHMEAALQSKKFRKSQTLGAHFSLQKKSSEKSDERDSQPDQTKLKPTNNSTNNSSRISFKTEGI